MSADIAPFDRLRMNLREARTEDDQLRAIPEWEYERAPPEREWMVAQCFPKGTVAMVSGDGGIGKSLLMQQLLTSAVLGREWLGMRCAPGRGIMLACEDDNVDLLRRQRDIESHMQIAHADLEGGLRLVSRVGCENALAELDRKAWRMVPTSLAKRLLQFCMQTGTQYVVVDTATQTFSGNQNDERQVVDYINILRRIAVAIQGIVILTKHPSLSGRANGSGESGNTAWHNSVRSRLYVRESVADNCTVISGMKSNYSRKLEKIRLKWQRGVFIQDSPEPVRHWLDRED